MKVEESLNVTFNETPLPPKTLPLEDDDLAEEEAIEVSKTRTLGNDLEDKSLENNKMINIKELKSHPLENVIEPKNINEVLTDESWVIAMQEELNQFISNDVWELVPNPKNMTIIGTKWVYRNKLDENGIVSRNKASIETIVYADSDHAGDYMDPKSTSGICMFMGCCLTSWFSKKQTALVISMTAAEYVSAGKACQQAL
ncbi:hypothetical protein Tco_1064189 [Tanacetum coccineum]